MIKGIIFDKDGTLFGFSESWNDWAIHVFNQLSNGKDDKKQALANALKFNLSTGEFYPESPVIAGTLYQSTELIKSILPEMTPDEILDFLCSSASTHKMAPIAPLPELLMRLKAMSLKLGVVTNDSIAPARAHLKEANIWELFDFVAGADSGFTPKPAPDALIGFAEHCGIAAKECVMVGDSLHDLRAGQAAGMKTIGVLTGLALHGELKPFSTLILPSIASLEDALQNNQL